MSPRSMKNLPRGSSCATGGGVGFGFDPIIVWFGGKYSRASLEDIEKSELDEELGEVAAKLMGEFKAPPRILGCCKA